MKIRTAIILALALACAPLVSTAQMTTPPPPVQAASASDADYLVTGYYNVNFGGGLFKDRETGTSGGGGGALVIWGRGLASAEVDFNFNPRFFGTTEDLGSQQPPDLHRERPAGSVAGFQSELPPLLPLRRRPHAFQHLQLCECQVEHVEDDGRCRHRRRGLLLLHAEAGGPRRLPLSRGRWRQHGRERRLGSDRGLELHARDVRPDVRVLAARHSRELDRGASLEAPLFVAPRGTRIAPDADPVDVESGQAAMPFIARSFCAGRTGVTVLVLLLTAACHPHSRPYSIPASSSVVRVVFVGDSLVHKAADDHRHARRGLEGTVEAPPGTAV